MPDPSTSVPLLSLENVLLHHPADGRPLLNRINGTFRPGERWAVVGPEGCGKSTLHRLMAGLIAPEEGAVRVQGLPYASLSDRSHRVGVLFAEPAPRFLTPVVWEEVALTPGTHGLEGSLLQQRVREALRWAGLPEAMATREVVSLSASQCARVALAAVLAAHPPLLLADEPAAHHSEEGEREMANLLMDHARGPRTMTSILFTSRMARAKRFADHILWLENGCLTPV